MLFSEDTGPMALSTLISFSEFYELMQHIKPAKKRSLTLNIRVLPGKEEYLDYYTRIVQDKNASSNCAPGPRKRGS